MSRIAGDEPPTIETVEGIGAAYLVWTREKILELERRVEQLEEARELDRPADERGV